MIDLLLLGQTFIKLSIKFFLISVAAALLHELGHFVYMRFELKQSVEIRFRYDKGLGFRMMTGYSSNYDGLSKEELLKLYLWGIIPGLIVVTIASLSSIIYMPVLVWYLIGCRRDIKNIWRFVIHGQRNSERA